MRLNRELCILGVASIAVLAAGCSQSTPSTNAGPASAGTQTVAKGGPPPDGSHFPRLAGKPMVARPSADDSGTDQTTPAFPGNQIPAQVKTEGYDYYGLTNSKPLTMKGEIDGQAKSGTTTTSLLSANAGKAVFKQTWTGDLAGLGDVEVSATAKGVYTTSVYGKTLADPDMEIPAVPQPGFTWPTHAKYKGPNNEDISLDGTNKVLGFQKIEIGGKAVDALVMQEVGVLKVNQNTSDVSMKKWMVKGVGSVKEEITTTSKTGNKKTSKTTLTATGL